jgi:large subunit ribosomal protein L22
MPVKASATNIRISARKVRLLLRELPGKDVNAAMAYLRYSGKPIARTVAKVLKSAAANAENNYQMSPDELRVVRAYADEARTLKRFRPRSRGRASPLLRRFSHITVIVDEV